MFGESSLSKDPNRSVASFIIDDVNDAHRRFVLAQVPIVVAGIVITDAGSETFDLPGRNSFIVESTVSSHIKASIDGLNWHQLNSSPGTYFTHTSQFPWRFFKVFAHAVGTSGTATFAAVKI